MSLIAYEASAGLFVRGLTNLKAQLTKAEDHAAATVLGEAALLDARLDGTANADGGAGYAPRDLHGYTLAGQVHWAAEGARLAIARLLDTPAVAAANQASSFADMRRRLDEVIAYMGRVATEDLEAGLARVIVVENPRGSVTADGGRFLLGFAIPHFYYHLSSAYAIMRNQGVQMTMGDFLGNWGQD